jgi:hypothetical protein
VYWNSRLQREHEHMVTTVVPPGTTVADVFCGVGPFAVPLGLRGCTVHANDLNPASHSALVENVRRNKVAQRVRCTNLDGRAFILTAFAQRLPFTVALMNLPADGLEFLDAFVGAWGHELRRPDAVAEGAAAPVKSASSVPQEYTPNALPVVHCYCFSKAETEPGAADDVLARALTALGLRVPTAAEAAAAGSSGAGGDPSTTGAGGPGGIDSPLLRAVRSLPGLLPDLTIRAVRDVAPRKLMLCVSFTLPVAVAEAAPVVTWASLDSADVAERAAAEAPPLPKRARTQ